VRRQQKPIRIVKGGTLRLTWPVGQTLGLAVLMLALIAGVCEGLARTGFVRSRLLSPSVVGGQDYLGAKLGALDRLAEEGERFDCIFLGDSMVAWGVDPAVFAAAYKARTGEDIHCYNFALLAATASEAAAWAEVLAQEYHPRLLIYPVSARDFSERASMLVLMTPWIEYRLGAFSPEGWLVEHSDAYRYYLTYSTWTLPDYHERLQIRARLEAEMYARRGFEAQSGALDVSTIPDAKDYPLIASALTGYQVSQEDLDGLTRLAALRQQGTEVVLVEVPLPATFMYFFENGEADYEKFTTQVGDHARSEGIPFWRTLSLDLIPADGWLNYSHLNQEGAEAFSEWLGARVGEAVQAGTIPDPTS
jgi:hypothetical protein